MAIATENIVLAKRKAFSRLQVGTTLADPFAFAQIERWFQYLSNHGSNPDLQVIPFDAASLVATTGQVLADAACKLYVVVAKKVNEGTDSYLNFYDDPVDDCDGATDARLSLGFLLGNDYVVYLNKTGIPMAAGVVATSYTDFDGTTKSAAAGAQNGFIIIGNP